MRTRLLATGFALATFLCLGPTAVEAQLVDRLKRAAERTVENETTRQMQRLLREAIRCAIDDPACPADARREDEDKDVIYTDRNGDVIVDDDGVPITDREQAAKRAGVDPARETPMVKPGEGLWANYDFVPGETVLYYDDFSTDDVGDFPRRWELVQGSWDVIEWQGDRYLRASSGGTVSIPLPRVLPERFTLEFPVSMDHGNAWVNVTTAPAYNARPRTYEGTVISVAWARAGIHPAPSGGPGPTIHTPTEHRYDEDGIANVRVMMDGQYMKIYLDEQRVANAPNAVFPRTDRLYFAASSASSNRPVLIGPVRVGEGGPDLYDRLTEDGRVATQGILFSLDSSTIRPESTPTLEEIGTMLRDHPELRIRIEGHTDSTGDDAYNQTLSEERAAAVRDFLVEEYGIDGSRLESRGLGEASPADSNDTPEGRQNNRRVELVRLDG